MIRNMKETVSLGIVSYSKKVLNIFFEITFFVKILFFGCLLITDLFFKSEAFISNLRSKQLGLLKYLSL